MLALVVTQCDSHTSHTLPSPVCPKLDAMQCEVPEIWDWLCCQWCTYKASSDLTHTPLLISFCHCDKCHDPKQLWGEKHLLHPPLSHDRLSQRTFNAGTKDRNLYAGLPVTLYSTSSDQGTYCQRSTVGAMEDAGCSLAPHWPIII